MRGKKGIHERFEIRPPPLRQRIPNLPFSIIDPFAGELGADGREAFIEAELKAFDFIVFGLKVVSWSNKTKQTKQTLSAKEPPQRKGMDGWMGYG